MFTQYVEKSLNERSTSTSSESSVRISLLLDDYNLPVSTKKELGAIIFDIYKLEKHGVVTRTKICGKNLISLTSFKKGVAALAKQCMIV